MQYFLLPERDALPPGRPPRAVAPRADRRPHTRGVHDHVFATRTGQRTHRLVPAEEPRVLLKVTARGGLPADGAGPALPRRVLCRRWSSGGSTCPGPPSRVDGPRTQRGAGSNDHYSQQARTTALGTEVTTMDVGIQNLFSDLRLAGHHRREAWPRGTHLARLAADLGFDCPVVRRTSLQRLFVLPRQHPADDAIAGRRVRNVGIGTAAVILPWHDPLRVAEQAACSTTQ